MFSSNLNDFIFYKILITLISLHDFQYLKSFSNIKLSFLANIIEK